MLNTRAKAAVLLILLFLAAWPAMAHAFLFFNKESRQGLFHTSRVDLGELIEGRTYTEEIRLRNTTSQVLAIDGIDVSCGCTKVEVLGDMVLPGEYATLRVTVDTTGKSGPVTKSVFIRTNGFMEPYLLELTSNILSHPAGKIDSSAIFRGDCRSCHAREGIERLSGEDLYDSACAACHGDTEALTSKGRERFVRASGYGVKGSSMPGFLISEGGPLTHAQVKSLADYIFGTTETARKGPKP